MARKNTSPSDGQVIEYKTADGKKAWTARGSDDHVKAQRRAASRAPRGGRASSAAESAAGAESAEQAG